MHLVSIVIPCYNYGWLLSETLDSVLAQTYSHWECIIIDDGSIDNSRAVAEEYQRRDARFQYIYQTNKGMSAARNSGIRAARGEYIQFLDADDLLSPRKLEIQVEFLDANPQVDLVYSDMRCFRHNDLSYLSRSFDMQDQHWMPEVSGRGEIVLNALIQHNIMAVNAALARKTLMQRVGPIAEDLRSVEDWEYWVRCAIADAYFHYDGNQGALALVRVHPTSTSHNTPRMKQNEVLARQRLTEMLEQIGATEALKINQAKLFNTLEVLAMDQVVKGNGLAGVKSFVDLAYKTGRYIYYVKSILYSFGLRLKIVGKT